GAQLRSRLADGRIDLALLLGPAEEPDARTVGELALTWYSAPHWTPPARGEPVPLVAFDAPCALRTQALETLAAHGVPAEGGGARAGGRGGGGRGGRARAGGTGGGPRRPRHRAEGPAGQGPGGPRPARRPPPPRAAAAVGAPAPRPPRRPRLRCRQLVDPPA